LPIGEHDDAFLGSRGEMPLPSQPHDIALKLWVVLARAFDAVDHHSRSSIARFGLGTTEFGVLEVLYHKGELAVCDVQRRILVESSSTTYVVTKLVTGGLVRGRHPSPDRRGVLAALTPPGRRVIERIFPWRGAGMRCGAGGRGEATRRRLPSARWRCRGNGPRR